MARFEGKFSAEGPWCFDLDELLGLPPGAGPKGVARQEAIARYLSASEGWDEVVRVLGGAFASDAERPERLSDDKTG